MHGWFVRAGLLGLVATLVNIIPGAAPAQAVSETEPVALPRAVRWDPRGAGVVGESSAGIVYMREGEPTSPTLRGNGETYLRASDGTETPLDAQATRVYGDRLIGWSSSTQVHSRVLPSGEPEVTYVPDGYSLITVTGDGLLLGYGAYGDRSLAVLPWSGGDPIPVAGLPSGRNVDSIASPAVADADGAVVYTSWSSGQQSESVYVDTATRTAWPLGFTGRDWGLGEGTISWLTTGASGERLIGTMPRPTQAAPTPPTATRPMPVTPGWDQSSNVSLLPVGDDVVVWQGGSLSWRQFSAGTVAPVVAVAPDGTARDLVGWGHDVRPATTPGEILLVGGEDAASSAVRRIDVASGDSTEVAPLEPVPAWTTQIAADDGGVAYVDTSERDGAFKERSVTLATDGTLQLGDEKRIGSPIEQFSCWSYPEQRCTNVVTGDGSLAWVEDMGSSVKKWALRTADGTVRTGDVPGSVSARGLTAVSRPWLMLDGKYLLDTRTNAATKLTDYGAADLLDGVAYVPGSAMETTPQGSVIMRDLDAGTVDSLAVPGCVTVGSVQAAGSWLLVSCSTAGGAKQLVIDRTGTTATWDLGPGSYYLGNGFVVRRDKDDLLTWTPLSGGVADWRELGTAGDHWATASVNRGSVPRVAWIDRTGQAFVKQLPVTTSPLPARPTNPLSAPDAPKVTADPNDGSVTVQWAPAHPDQKVTGYVVRGGVDRSSRVLGPEVTSATFRNLKNGSTYNFSVTAQNIAGESSASVQATPLGRPTAPENIEVTVDERTSTAQVTWTWWQAPATEPVTSFDIEVGQPVVTGLPASARSAKITVPWPTTGPVTVVANGEDGSRSADSAPVTFPGVDSTAPVVTAPAVPRVLLGTQVGVPLKARDDRELASVDLRWRSAASGARLGSWSYPSAWQRQASGRVTVTGLRRGHTYCFSSRARDAAGNVSKWTAQRCSVVALDDRALARSGSWQLPTGRRFYLGTASSTTAKLATLSREGVRADAAYLVATTCPSCGTIRVQVGYDEWGKVRLRSAVRRDRQIIALPWPMALQGRLVLRPVPGTGRVTIDGIAPRSY